MNIEGRVLSKADEVKSGGSENRLSHRHRPTRKAGDAIIGLHFAAGITCDFRRYVIYEFQMFHCWYIQFAYLAC